MRALYLKIHFLDRIAELIGRRSPAPHVSAMGAAFECRRVAAAGSYTTRSSPGWYSLKSA